MVMVVVVVVVGGASGDDGGVGCGGDGGSASGGGGDGGGGRGGAAAAAGAGACAGASAGVRRLCPLHRTSVSPRAFSGTLSFQERVFAGNLHHRRGFPAPQAAPPKSIMSTVLPNTPFQKSKDQMFCFWGGAQGRTKGAHHEHQQGLGGRKVSCKTP